MRRVIASPVIGLVIVVLVLVSVFLYFWISYEPDTRIDQWLESRP